MNLKCPIYFSAGMTEKANNYYKMFISWTNEKIRKTFVDRNMFDFRHIKSFDRSYIDNPGPMVVFATPGMLHAGSKAAFEVLLHLFRFVLVKSKILYIRRQAKISYVITMCNK
jgi:Cft2 family RNA processing exonuclease